MRSRGLLCSALLLAMTPFVPGCERVPGQVRLSGAQDLDCPIETVSAYRGEDGAYVARGCGKWAEYDCLSTRFDVMCVPHAAAEVHVGPAPANDEE
jgi:hypothetical protein